MQAAHTAVKSDVAASEGRLLGAIEATERRQQASEGRLLGAIEASERRQQEALLAAVANMAADNKEVKAEAKASTAQLQRWVTAGTVSAVILSALFAVTSAAVAAFWPQIMRALAVAIKQAL